MGGVEGRGAAFLSDTHIESKLQSLDGNLIKSYTYVQRKPEKSVVRLKSSVRLDEQSREGESQEHDPSDDCDYRGKTRGGKKRRGEL